MLSNKLQALKSHTFKLTKLNLKRLHGHYFTVQPNTSEIVKGESVNLYTGPEYQEVHEYLTNKGFYDIIPKKDSSYKTMVNIWQNCVFDTSLKAKYFSLLPFFFEDRSTSQAQKKFILKMDLLPESKHFRFVTILGSGMLP